MLLTKILLTLLVIFFAPASVVVRLWYETYHPTPLQDKVFDVTVISYGSLILFTLISLIWGW